MTRSAQPDADRFKVPLTPPFGKTSRTMIGDHGASVATARFDEPRCSKIEGNGRMGVKGNAMTYRPNRSSRRRRSPRRCRARRHDHPQQHRADGTGRGDPPPQATARAPARRVHPSGLVTARLRVPGGAQGTDLAPPAGLRHRHRFAHHKPLRTATSRRSHLARSDSRSGAIPPPSTIHSAPVTGLDSGEIRYAITLATSSGSPIRAVSSGLIVVRT